MQAYLYNVVPLPTERGELVSDSVTFWKIVQVRIRGGPPLTLGFEAPKLSIFGPYLIFP